MNQRAIIAPQVGRDEGNALLSAVAQGDEEAFRQLYARFSAPLFSLICKMLHSPQDAEEVLQTAFVQVWKRAGSFQEGRCSPFTWLVMITRGRALDRLRQQQRHGRLMTKAEPELVQDANQHPSGEEIHQQEERTAMAAALRTIPPDQRQAIELAFFHGLSHTEISEQLSEPLGTIKARIRRGLLRLRDSIHRQP